MDILFVMVIIAAVLSGGLVRRALPFESFLAFVFASLAMTALLLAGRLA